MKDLLERYFSKSGGGERLFNLLISYNFNFFLLSSVKEFLK